jgi:diaminopropionate ammonia-lyase
MPPLVVLSVEAENAPAIIASLHARKPVTVDTTYTIMAGLNCGTPSAGAWPYLEAGLDAATTVSDEQATQAVHDLAGLGFRRGPVRRRPGRRTRRRHGPSAAR